MTMQSTALRGNKTMNRLLELSGNARENAILGPTTPLDPQGLQRIWSYLTRKHDCGGFRTGFENNTSGGVQENLKRFPKKYHSP